MILYVILNSLAADNYIAKAHCITFLYPQMFELLLSLCAIPTVRQSINNRLFAPLTQNATSLTDMLEATSRSLAPDTEPLLCCIHWAAQDLAPGSSAPCLALDFLIDSCQVPVIYTFIYTFTFYIHVTVDGQLGQ